MRSAALYNLQRTLATALACACAAPLLAQSPPVSSIRVSGEARVSAKPDRVQVDVGVSTRADSSQQAAAQNARAVEAVLAALRRAAPANASLKTLSYTLSPNYQYHPNGAEPTLNGYTAGNVVQVTLDDLSRIGPVIDAATQAGANRVQGIQFTLRDQDSVRTQALREAAQRARADAEALAAALGLRITRVLSVEENSPRLTPVVLTAMRADAAAAATPVEAGSVEVNAQVTLSVEVAAAAH